MAQISVGQIENFRETLSAMLQAREMLQNTMQSELTRLEGIVTDYRQETDNYRNSYEQALQYEAGCQQHVDDCQAEYDSAEQELNEAQIHLDSLRS
jgi:chromosome segregation ATPase